MQKNTTFFLSLNETLQQSSIQQGSHTFSKKIVLNVWSNFFMAMNTQKKKDFLETCLVVESLEKLQYYLCDFVTSYQKDEKQEVSPAKKRNYLTSIQRYLSQIWKCKVK